MRLRAISAHKSLERDPQRLSCAEATPSAGSASACARGDPTSPDEKVDADLKSKIDALQEDYVSAQPLGADRRELS